MKAKLWLLSILLLSIDVSAVLIWDGSETSWTLGNGTETNPYLIETPQQLASLSKKAATNSFSGKYFKQMDDFDLNNTPFTPIGTSENHAFKGYYDGNGKYIANLKINAPSSSDYCALFGYAINATISNLSIKGTFSSTNSSGNMYSAAFVGYGKDVTFINCTNEANVQGGDYCGGLAAYLQGNSNFSNCSNYGKIQSTLCCGGLVGYAAECTIRQCSNYGSITSYSKSNNTSNVAGGLIGSSLKSLIVSQSFNMGAISAKCQNSYNPVGITVSSFTVKAHSGGIVGYAEDGTIFQCFSVGDIDAYASSGYFGSYPNSCSYSYAYSSGIIGSGSISLTYCYVRGKINSYASAYAAKYSGSKNTEFSYSSGLGYTATTTNCYFAGTISAKCGYTNNVNLFGTTSGITTNSYFNSDCGASTSQYGIAQTTDQMKATSFPSLLNGQGDVIFVFDTDVVNDGYPIFGWQSITTYQITGTCNADEGSVTGSGEYVKDSTATLTAIPNDCYQFIKWSDNNTDNPRSITVTQDSTFTAIFEKIQFNLSVEVNDSEHSEVETKEVEE